MSELPPDAARLRAIMTFLDEQIARNDTVGVYLRLQRGAVEAALARAEGQRPPEPRPRKRQQRPAAPPAFTAARRGHGSTGFAVEQQPRAMGPEPARIHTDGCPHGDTKHPISAHDARAALVDPQVEACPFCRPDDELGLDLD
ncbi:DUF6233 domain-containing protein [Streptomyces sp. NPDC051954]|uniref:DUF6233 domain-containing protein n=1 Tax=unclassified Streptomyces TaxID=2593676 RepID=UPI003438E651